jgi:hypothetical protein
MRRGFLVLSAVLATAALAATPALAQNVHFIRSSDSLTNSGALKANFKIAGLGDNETITVTLMADAQVQYACFNHGEKHPQAKNKEFTSGTVSASGDFTSGQNGQITGSLTAEPPGPGNFSCPPGQDLRLTYVNYTNVTLTAGGDTVSLDDQTFGEPV